MTKILVDFSQTVISACAAQARDIRDDDNDSMKGFIKHIALSMLLSWKKKFNGELIIVCDSRRYWRKEEFKYYKGHRKHEKKDITFINWEVLFEAINELKIEIADNFPYKVIEVDGAEADDIIAALVKYYDENELVNTGLMEEPNDIVIVSTDADFQQLQKYSNVKQWNNVMKKWVVCKNPKQFLIEHIVEGDKGDNIPSITTSDEWSKLRSENTSTRAVPFKSSRMKDFYSKGIDACNSEDEKRNWKRNELLIDFDMIPSNINTKVITEFLDITVKGSKPKILNYLTKNRMKLLLGSIGEF